MPLSSGTKLGFYEVTAPLGAGGMGEVYRARDTRLGRDVAIKILAAELSTNRDRMARFEQEARSASSLNHPNIITIYDIGSMDSTSYIAMEWVDGRTLREISKDGPMPARKVVQIAVQLADGLTKAHEAGIVHRDLKPENIMITKDGFAKILDFGLAKLFLQQSGSEVSALPTSAGTDAGTILGTVGYMSPEQASGKVVDFRSDQFSLGAILYEILTGKRAFEEKTTIETLAAIIKNDPEPISSRPVQVPAPLRWIVDRCLEKNPEDRYASTRDLAHDLQSVRDHFSEVASSSETAVPIQMPKRSLKKIWSIANAALLLILGAFTLYLLLNPKKAEKDYVDYHRLTYQRGTIHTARFASDGQTIIYSATFGEHSRDLYLTRTEGVESRALGIPNADILSISPSGEMLLLILRKTLAQVPITGGLPRELDKNVTGADWARDGKSMAIARVDSGETHLLEYPPGSVRYKSTQRIDTLRFSPNGNFIAFIEGMPAGSNGSVRILNLSGQLIASSTRLYPDHLTWSPDGNEVWFSSVADAVGAGYELYGLSTMGKQRLISKFPSSFVIHDSSKGKLIAEFSDYRGIVMAGTDGKEKELSWLDNSDIRDFSSDGKMLLIHERGEGAESPGGTMYVRGLDGSAAIRIAAGVPVCFSPENLSVLGFSGLSSMVIVPIGAGTIRRFDYPQFNDIKTVQFLPNGKQFLLIAGDKEGHTEVMLQDVVGGKPKTTGIKNFYPSSDAKILSGDGRYIFGQDNAGNTKIYSLETASPIPFSGLEQNEELIEWTQSSDAIFVFNNDSLPSRVYKIAIADGHRTLFKEIIPPDRAGLTRVRAIRISPDEKSYAYTYIRNNGTLYLMDGIH
jgi:serine/threonine protein kinase